jgi:hypothetical protein
MPNIMTTNEEGIDDGSLRVEIDAYLHGKDFDAIKTIISNNAYIEVIENDGSTNRVPSFNYTIRELYHCDYSLQEIKDCILGLLQYCADNKVLGQDTLYKRGVFHEMSENFSTNPNVSLVLFRTIEEWMQGQSEDTQQQLICLRDVTQSSALITFIKNLNTCHQLNWNKMGATFRDFLLAFLNYFLSVIVMPDDQGLSPFHHVVKVLEQSASLIAIKNDYTYRFLPLFFRQFFEYLNTYAMIHPGEEAANIFNPINPAGETPTLLFVKIKGLDLDWVGDVGCKREGDRNRYYWNLIESLGIIQQTDLTTTDNRGRNLLHYALANNLWVLMWVMKWVKKNHGEQKYNALLAEHDENGLVPSLYALETNSYTAQAFLPIMGRVPMDIMAKNSNHYTGLMAACKRQGRPVLNELFRCCALTYPAGAILSLINSKDCFENTALYYALSDENIEAVSFLCDKIKEFLIIEREHKSIVPLDKGAVEEQEDTFRRNIFQINDAGISPFILACLWKEVKDAEKEKYRNGLSMLVSSFPTNLTEEMWAQFDFVILEDNQLLLEVLLERNAISSDMLNKLLALAINHQRKEQETILLQHRANLLGSNLR